MKFLPKLFVFSYFLIRIFILMVENFAGLMSMTILELSFIATSGIIHKTLHSLAKHKI